VPFYETPCRQFLTVYCGVVYRVCWHRRWRLVWWSPRCLESLSTGLTCLSKWPTFSCCHLQCRPTVSAMTTSCIRMMSCSRVCKFIKLQFLFTNLVSFQQLLLPYSERFLFTARCRCEFIQLVVNYCFNLSSYEFKVKRQYRKRECRLALAMVPVASWIHQHL